MRAPVRPRPLLLFGRKDDDQPGGLSRYPVLVRLVRSILEVSLLLFCFYLIASYILRGSEGGASNLSASSIATASTPCKGRGCSQAVSPITISKVKKPPPPFDLCELEIVGGRPKDGYGAWPLCRNHVPPNATVFSIGIGGDVSFDVAMLKRGCRIFAFDPTVKPPEARDLFKGDNAPLVKGFSFMQAGLGAENGLVGFMYPKNQKVRSMTSVVRDLAAWRYQQPSFEAPVLTLPTMLAVTKQSYIDLLKVDVEGVEFDVCDTEEFIEALDHVGQLLFELHERHLQNPAGRKERCTQRLLAKGFREVKRTRSEEYVFARVVPGAKVEEVPRKRGA